MDDDLEPRRLERHCVAGSVDEAYERIARRDDEIAQRVDRDAIAGEPLCEGGVGHLIERNETPEMGESSVSAPRSAVIGPGPVESVTWGMPGTCDVSVRSARDPSGTGHQ